MKTKAKSTGSKSSIRVLQVHQNGQRRTEEHQEALYALPTVALRMISKEKS